MVCAMAQVYAKRVHSVRSGLHVTLSRESREISRVSKEDADDATGK